MRDPRLGPKDKATVKTRVLFHFGPFSAKGKDPLQPWIYQVRSLFAFWDLEGLELTFWPDF